MRAGVFLVSLLAAVVLAGPANAADPVLTGDVGAGDAFSITLKDDSGAAVTHLAVGTYTLVVHDRSTFHNFRLSGPGVDVATPIESTGDSTFTVSVVDGTYSFICDAHPTQMKGTFTVGTVTTTTTTTTSKPPPPPPATKLAAAIGPGASISLKPAAGLAAGKFAITVNDRSATDGFRLAGPGLTKSTGAKFKGTVKWSVTLKAGRYTFGSALRPKLRRAFTVSG
jgi:plastocyanin